MYELQILRRREVDFFRILHSYSVNAHGRVVLSQYRAFCHARHPKHALRFYDSIAALIDNGFVDLTKIEFRGSRLDGISITKTGEEYIIETY